MPRIENKINLNFLTRKNVNTFALKSAGFFIFIEFFFAKFFLGSLFSLMALYVNNLQKTIIKNKKERRLIKTMRLQIKLKNV